MNKNSNNTDTNRIKMVIKFDSILDNLQLSKNIEKSIYNYVIDVAKEKNITRLWSNNVLLKLYINKCISIYTNLKQDSYIKNNYLLDSILSDMDLFIPSLQVDGGATSNNFLMQFQSDILKMNIDRPHNIESTALGAGMLAGIGSGFWNNPEELKAMRTTDKVFNPSIDDKARTALLLAWRRAIQKTLST